MRDDGSYKLLENRIDSGLNPDTLGFKGDITTTLMLNQLMLPSEASGETLFLGAFGGNTAAFADALALYPDFEQDGALMKLLEYTDDLVSRGQHKWEYVTEYIEGMSDYTGSGAGVFDRLGELMEHPVSVHSF